MFEDPTKPQDNTPAPGNEGDAHPPASTGTTPPDTSADWRSGLPPELQGAPQIKDIKDAGSLVKQFIDLQRFVGNSVRVPGEHATPEDREKFLAAIQSKAPELLRKPDPSDEKAMQEFWRTAGVPDSEDGYLVDDGIDPKDEIVLDSKRLAKQYGLTQKAFKKLVKDRVEAVQKQRDMSSHEHKEDMQALSKEWGMATETKMNDVALMAEKFGFPDDFVEALKNKGVGSKWLRPLDKMLQALGGLGEGSEFSIQPGHSIETPGDLKARQSEIMNNPAYLNPRDPMHKVLVKENFEIMQKLGRIN